MKKSRIKLFLKNEAFALSVIGVLIFITISFFAYLRFIESKIRLDYLKTNGLEYRLTEALNNPIIYYCFIFLPIIASLFIIWLNIKRWNNLKVKINDGKIKQ